jgi:PAS domain S-box-containing protein
VLQLVWIAASMTDVSRESRPLGPGGTTGSDSGRGESTRRSLAVVAVLANALVVAVVLAVAVGWFVNSDLLRTFGADFPAAQLSSVLAFLVAVAALHAAQRGAASAVRRARIGATVIAAIAVLMLAGHALGIRAGLDLAFLGLARDRGYLPVLMPVATALALELVAAGIVFTTVRAHWAEAIGRTTAIVLLAVALLAIVGYGFTVLLAHGGAPLLGMALPDAIAFFLIGVSLLAGRPDTWLADFLAAERPGAVMARWLLPAAIVVPILAHLAQLAAQQAGLVNEPLGLGLLVLLTVAGIGALTLWIGRALDRMNARRARAEAEARAQRESLQAAYAELDARVIERTAALERATTALSERNRLFTTITGSTSDLIFAKDLDGRLLMVNAAYLAVIGRAEVDVIGRTSLELATDREAGRVKANHDRVVVQSGQSLTAEEIFPGPSAPRIYLTTKSPLRDEQGRVVGLVGVATDITDRKRAERALEALLGEEQQLREEAERANRAKDEFLAIVSHELRSPLNALRGWGHLLASTRPLDPSLVDRATAAIKRNVEHQARLIDDLLDTSRSISGRLTIERAPVNLAEVVHAAVEIARPAAAARGVALRETLAQPATTVDGDAGRLQQVLTNLLSNAIKFTPQSGEVTVSLAQAGDRVRLAVRDNGAGIAPEFLPHVFERFTQADTSSTRRAGGLGIGLALVRNIVDLHGGTVRAESPGPGGGATFTVELPASAVAVALPASAPAPTIGARRLAGREIVLVDDDPDARDTIGLALRQSGAEVAAFDSGDAALAVLANRPPARWPDVLLLDLAMPGEDGFAVLGRVRELERAGGIPRVPAIAVTAFTQTDRGRLRAAGFQELVGKPVDTDRLVTAIEAAVRANAEVRERSERSA